MFKKITALLLITVMLLCCGCATQKNVEITGTDNKVIPKIENIIELQKCLFLAKINSVETVDAVFTKYNVDISSYTLFNVTITESFDGYTPTGNAKVYWLGTDDEFPTRLPIEKNESYILDCEVWVYGDEIVYLLAPYSESFPKVDIANAVTIATGETQALDVCSLDEYRTEYQNAYNNVCDRIEGFADLKAVAERYYNIFLEMNQKNSNTAFYSDAFEFEYTPSDEHIAKTAQKTLEVFNKAQALKDSDTVTKDQIAELLK